MFHLTKTSIAIAVKLWLFSDPLTIGIAMICLGTQKFSKKYRYVNDVPNSCKETITKVTSQDEEHYIVTPLRASVSEARLDAIYG